MQYYKKYILFAIAVAARLTQQGYVVKDAIHGTLFGHNPVDNPFFTSSGNNTKIEVLNNEGLLESKDFTIFEGADLQFFDNNIGHALVRYNPILKNIYFQNENSSADFKLSFCDDEKDDEKIEDLSEDRKEMVKNQYQLFEKLIFPIFSNITADGIKLQNDGANSLCIGSDKNSESIAYANSSKSKKFAIKFAKDSALDGNLYYRKLDLTTPMHEFLHILGFNHPHGSNLENREGYRLSQERWSRNTDPSNPIDTFEINTATSYASFKDIAINLAHFEYILDPLGPIYKKLPSKAKEKIKEFVDKYGKALALGLTPIDISELQSAYGAENIADDAKNIIKEAGVKYFLFASIEQGSVAYLGTRDLIDNEQLDTYCKKSQTINDLRETAKQYDGTLACDIDWSLHYNFSRIGKGVLFAAACGLLYYCCKKRNNNQVNQAHNQSGIELSQRNQSLARFADEEVENNPSPTIAPERVSALNTRGALNL